MKAKNRNSGTIHVDVTTGRPRFSGQDEGESIVFVSSLQPFDISGVSRWRDQEGALGSKITRARVYLAGDGWILGTEIKLQKLGDSIDNAFISPYRIISLGGGEKMVRKMFVTVESRC